MRMVSATLSSMVQVCLHLCISGVRHSIYVYAGLLYSLVTEDHLLLTLSVLSEYTLCQSSLGVVTVSETSMDIV